MKNEEGSLTGGPSSGWGNQQPPRPAGSAGGGWRGWREQGATPRVLQGGQRQSAARQSPRGRSEAAGPCPQLREPRRTPRAAAPRARGEPRTGLFQCWYQRNKTPMAQPWRALAAEVALGGGLDRAAGQRDSSLGGANRPFQVCAALQGPALQPARSSGGACSPPAASPGGRGGAAPSHAPPGAANRRRRSAPREASPAGQQAKCE